MNSLERKWSVAYQHHDCNDAMYTDTTIVVAQTINDAIDEIDNSLSRHMDIFGWHDYHITSVNIVPELH